MSGAFGLSRGLSGIFPLRIYFDYATPAGRELIGRLHGEIRRALAPWVDRLTPEQREQLVKLLMPIVEEAERTSVQMGRARQAARR